MREFLRNLAYCSVVIAAASATLHFTTLVAKAVPPTSACIVGSGGLNNYLTADSRIVTLDARGWTVRDQPPLPIPTTQVAFAGVSSVVDVNGNGWAVHADGSHWVNFGPFPCELPIQTAPSTWSKLKAPAGRPR